MTESSSEAPKRSREDKSTGNLPPKRTKVATDPVAERQAPMPIGNGDMKSHDPPQSLTEMVEW
jgi:hypothetical protein